jgi:COMPASS component SPP1
MQTRLDAWAKKGGKKDKLWESVKNAEKREGIVISADDSIFMKGESEDGCKREETEEIKPRKGKVERELERLNGVLDQVVKLREEIKKGMEVVVWREKLIELASERAEQVDQCGWDQRLCFGDDEWADFGAGVLESYEDVKAESNQGDMQVDGVSEELGEWWCPGKNMCDRHAG